MRYFKVEFSIPNVGLKTIRINGIVSNDDIQDYVMEEAEKHEFNYVGHTIGKEADVLREMFYKGVFSSTKVTEISEQDYERG